MKLSRIAAAVALTSAISAPAFAVDGAFSATSSVGSTQLTATVGNYVRVSAIDDPIALVPVASDLAATDSICLFRGGADNQPINVTFTSAAGGATFQMTDGTNLLAYGVTLNAGGTGYAAGSGTPITATNATDNVVDCTANGGTNASYDLIVTQATLSLATPGVYTDTLTITVAPI